MREGLSFHYTQKNQAGVTECYQTFLTYTPYKQEGQYELRMIRLFLWASAQHRCYSLILIKAPLLDIARLNYCCLYIRLSLLSCVLHHRPPLPLTGTLQLASVGCGFLTGFGNIQLTTATLSHLYQCCLDAVKQTALNAEAYVILCRHPIASIYTYAQYCVKCDDLIHS